MRQVRIFGGGVSGLTVAHELACRGGFDVIVHEPLEELGGKARSQFHGGLPGEHGFRFFPGWYLHVTDIMRRIPLDPAQTDPTRALAGYAPEQSVVSRLREVHRTLNYFEARPPESFLQIPDSIADLPEFLAGFGWLTAGLSAADRLRTLKRIALKFLLFYSTPPWLRAGRFDGVTLAEFLGADSLPAPVTEALRTVPKALVAMDAYEGSAFTFLNTSLLNLAPAWQRHLPKDRVLRGPTSRAWLEPWVATLRALGVRFVHGDAGRAARVLVDRGRAVAVETRSNERLTADAFVLALPVAALRELVRASALDGLGADFRAIANVDVQRQTSEMVGLQLYLRKPLATQPGHLFFPESQYGLTAISQLEIWDEEHVAPLRSQGIEGLLSIDITQWRTDPFNRTPPRFTLPIDVESPAELAELVVQQLAVYRNRDGSPLLAAADVQSHHVDDDIDLATEENRAELLVHPPGTWARRPLAKSSLEGLYFGSDFAKNPADLATMEGACSSGKLAARAILERFAPGAPPVTVHELVQELEPPWLAEQQRGFEALLRLIGGFERAERALEELLDAEDDALASLERLRQRLEAPLGPLRRRWLAVTTWAMRRLGWSGRLGAKPEPERAAREREAAFLQQLQRVCEALRHFR